MANRENTSEAAILIVDDDSSMCETLADIIKSLGYTVDCVTHVAQAKKKLKENFFNILVVDLKLSDGNGIELLRYAKEANPETLAIIFTGYASLESSISALNEGAFGTCSALNIEEVKITDTKGIKMQQLGLRTRNFWIN
jgi:DNA-binding NtrC family response regulator